MNLTLSFVLLLTAVCAVSVEAIRCYAGTDDTLLEQSCPSGVTRCFNTTFKDQSGVTTVTRGCSALTKEVGCSGKVDKTPGIGKTCYCKENLCNGKESSHSLAVKITSSVMMMMVTSFMVQIAGRQ